MKTLFSFSVAIFCCTVFASSAFALTDEQYNLFMEKSIQFKMEETELNAIWKMIKSTIPQDTYNTLLKEQRAWNNNRDAEARIIQEKSDGTLSLADCYAKATKERIAYLKDVYLFGNGKPVSSPSPVQPNYSQVDIVDIAGKYEYDDEDPDGSTYGVSAEIENKGNNNYHVVITWHVVNARSFLIRFEGTGSIVNGILVVKGKRFNVILENVMDESETLKIYYKQHPDIIRCADKKAAEAKKEKDAERKKELKDEASRFRNFKEPQIAIINELGAGDVLSRYEEKK